jgi:hypothetical protein
MAHSRVQLYSTNRQARIPTGGPALHNEVMFVDIVFDGPPGPESGRFVASGFTDRKAIGRSVSAHPISPAWRAIRRMAINNTPPDLAVEL